MSKVLFKKTGRIGRIALNRPEVLNASDSEVPVLLSQAVAAANTDPDNRHVGLSARVGESQAMLFTGDKIDGREAQRLGLANTQRLATLLDGVTRHSPEGLAFKQRAEAVGWKTAVEERDRGLYDWTEDRPIESAE